MQNLGKLTIPMLPFILFRDPPSISSVAPFPLVARTVFFPRFLPSLLSIQPTAFSTPWSTRFSFFLSADREGNGMMHASTHTHTHTHNRDRGELDAREKKCNNYNTSDRIQPAFPPFPRVDGRWSFTPLFFCIGIGIDVVVCVSASLCFYLLACVGIFFLFLFPSVRARECLWEHKEKNGSCCYEKTFYSLFNKHWAQTKPKTMRVVLLLVKIF